MLWRIRPRAGLRRTARFRHRYRMADRDLPVANEHFLDERAQNFLPLNDVQRPGAGP